MEAQMALEAGDLVAPILTALKAPLGKAWNAAKDYAEGEAKKMAQTLADIARFRAAGQIDDVQARALLDMQKHAMQAVLLTIEGIGLIAAQNAINGALGAVRTVVNKAVGFALI
jgi:hypothetical protein